MVLHSDQQGELPQHTAAAGTLQAQKRVVLAAHRAAAAAY
jgi:hypothetical protein